LPWLWGITFKKMFLYFFKKDQNGQGIIELKTLKKFVSRSGTKY
jgi:hypothetical protein